MPTWRWRVGRRISLKAKPLRAMDELIYIASYVINLCACAIACLRARSAIAAGGDIKTNVNRFTALAVAAGLISGFPLLLGIFWVFERAGYPVSLGHGEGLVAAPLLDFVLGLLMAGLGRMLLRWRAIHW